MPESWAWQQATDEEFARARQLERVTLFAELNLGHDDIERARDFYGRVLREKLSSLGFAALVDRFPALTLTTLIGHAGLNYDQGKYWESFWHELGLRHEHELENLLRSRLRPLLRKFGLNEFPELKTQYVQVMAVHAGIPVHCLDDLVDVIEQHIAAGREPRGAAVFEWLMQPGLDYRMNDLDVPVRNLFRFGGEVAADLVDRIIEFGEYTIEHPDVANDTDLDSSTTGLPDVLLEALIDRWSERPFGSRVGVVTGHRARNRGPAIAYSRDDDQLIVEVPYPATGAETPWLITIDGEVCEVYAERGWGYAAGEAHPPTPFALPRKGREVVLRHGPSNADHRIPLVDKANPLLCFDADGRSLSRYLALPRGEVIGLHPAEAALVHAITTQAIPFTTVTTPTGWRDWHARVYDLTGVDAVRLTWDGRLWPAQQVRRSGAARLELAEPVEGVRTRSGLPVYGDRPEVELPAASAHDPVQWRVRVRRATTVDWLADTGIRVAADPVHLDPFDGLEPGLLGLFDIVVTGPPGQDLRCTLFLAEGLGVVYDAEFRLPRPGGMSAILAEVSAAEPLFADRSLFQFEDSERNCDLRLRAGAIAERVVLQPPFVEVRADLLGASAQWRTVAPVLTLEDLSEPLVLAVRVPGSVEVDMVLVDAHGDIHQYATPRVNRDNVFEVDVREFADTARALRTATVTVRIDTSDGTTSEVPVARFQPRTLCAGVRLSGERLQFDEPVDADLAAFVWADTAPWHAPVTVEIVEGAATLPAELVNSGPLTVQIYVDDPWVVVAAPAHPEGGAFTVAQDGWMRDADPARAALSCFFAGEGEPPTQASVLPEVWSIFADVGLRSVRPGVRSGLLQVLRADPRSAIEALDRSAISRDLLPAALIRAGVIERDFSSPIRDADPANPWLGALLGIADLPMLALTGRVAEGEVARSTLTMRGGDSLVSLLAGVKAEAFADVFDVNTVMLHFLPDANVADIKAACEIVPGALLDEGTRRSAMFEAFAQRRAWQHEPARTALTEASAELMSQLRRAGTGPNRTSAAALAYDVVKARNEALTGADTTTHPWLLMSMQSLLFAITARLIARDALPAAQLTAPMREAWARLAELCPALIGTDLLIADALACYALHDNVIDKIGVSR